MYNITCRDDFIELNNTCHPRCDRWKEGSDVAVVVRRGGIILASIIALLGCSVFLVASAVHHKQVYALINMSCACSDYLGLS